MTFTQNINLPNGRTVNAKSLGYDKNGNHRVLLTGTNDHGDVWVPSRELGLPMFDAKLNAKARRAAGLRRTKNGYTMQASAPAEVITAYEIANGGEAFYLDAEGVTSANAAAVEDIQRVRGHLCGLPTDTYQALTIYRSLRKLNAIVTRWNEKICNVELTARQEKAADAADAAADAKLHAYFPGLNVRVNGDPRGYALKVELPENFKNEVTSRDWGGYFVPVMVG